MPSKNTIKSYTESGIYHIYNRGVEKRKIFLDKQDYDVLLSYLKDYLLPKNEKELKRNYEKLKNLYQELQATQSQLVQHSKLVAIGQLAAGVAHEINNPIAYIARTSVSKPAYSSPQLRKSLFRTRKQLTESCILWTMPPFTETLGMF